MTSPVSSSRTANDSSNSRYVVSSIALLLPSIPGIYEIHKFLIFLKILPGRQQFLTLWTHARGHEQ